VNSHAAGTWATSRCRRHCTPHRHAVTTNEQDQGEASEERRCFLRSRAAPTPPKSHVSAGLAHATAQANRRNPAGHGEAHSSTGKRDWASACGRALNAPRCGARSKRTGKPCRGAAMPNGRCKLHGGKSTGPRTPEGLERSRRANWKHGHFSREAKAERSRVRAAILALRDLRNSI
jgi:hypothetical protein